MKKLLPVLCVGLVSPLWAQVKMKPIIHSSKQDVAAKHVIDDYRVVDSEKIEMTQPHQIEEVLRTLPGVVSASTGVIGGKSSIFVRGSEARHTIILIDGVRYYDPTSPDRTINLALLKTVDIEKIEFLRGSQGVLYGSDAIGGVINIITRKGNGDHAVSMSRGYFTQYNTQNTFVLGKNIFSINAHYFETEGLSAAKDETEKDHNVNRGFNLKHSYESERFSSETTIKYIDAHVDTDAVELTTGKPIDEDGTFSKDVQSYFNQKAQLNLTDQRTLHFNLGFSKYKRKEKFFDDSLLQYNRFFFDGNTMTAEVKIKEQFLDGSLIYGISQNQDTYDNDDIEGQTQDIMDLFANHHQQYWGYNFSYGGRLTRNQDFGDHLVYKLAVEREFYHKRLKPGATLGTGFKAPSIYQQFAPNGLGNTNLSPEKSFDWEVFNEFNYKNYQNRLGYFNLEIDSLIEFRNSQFANAGTLLARGVEFGQKLSFDKFYVSLDMTLQTLEKEDGSRFLRRPEKVYDLAYGHYINDRHSMQVLVKWVGERYDLQGGNEEYLSEYAVTDLSYRFNRKNISIIATIKNVFDAQYEVVKDYSTLGRNVAVNIKATY